MADAEGKKPIRPGDNFISKIVQDPANPPELMRMTGYRGASPEKEHVRLYADPELSVYWDIPEADVLYEQAVPPETDPLGAVTLWVKRDSKLIHKHGTKGAENAMHTMTPYCNPGAGGGGFAAAPQAQAQYQLTPTITIHNSLICHSYLAPCPPSPLPYLCHSPLPYCLPTHQPYCVPHVSPYCPTTLHPTTIETTFAPQQQQAQPQAEAYRAAAAGPAPQGFTFTLPPSLTAPCTISPIPLHCTYPPPPSPIPLHCTISPIQCTASPQPVHCTIATIASAANNCTIPVSHVIHCTIPLSPILVHCTQPSPTPQCVVQSAACTIVASPNCPNTQPTTFPTFPTTFPTTEPTTAGPGTAVGATGFAAQAAAPQQQAQILRPTTIFTGTAFPSEILYQCTHVTRVTPASPYCTFPTVTYTYPTFTPRTYGGTYGGGY